MLLEGIGEILVQRGLLQTEIVCNPILELAVAYEELKTTICR